MFSREVTGYGGAAAKGSLENCPLKIPCIPAECRGRMHEGWESGLEVSGVVTGEKPVTR